MKTIMVATDFSERSDRALRRATLLARDFAAGIVLVHVVDDDQPRRIVDSERIEAEKLLRQMAGTLRSVDGLDCETRVVLADPFAGIAGAVEEGRPDLLVIGSHRRRILRDVFIGTTAERTIRSVFCPVLMVNAPPAGAYRHILLTTDLSDGSRDALEGFARLGLGGRARVSLLHVFDAPALRLAFSHTMPKDDQEHYLDGERKNATGRLSEFIASARIGHPEPLIRHESAATQHEIVKAAEDERADLIVLSTHGRGGLAKFFIGSVTEQVLRVASVDVLALPPMSLP